MKGVSLTKTATEIVHDADLINRNLERLFFIGLDDMIGRLDDGSRLLDYFDEPICAATAKAMIDEVNTLIKLYETRIEVESVAIDLTADDEANQQVTIYLTWHKLETPETSNLTTINKIYSI
jgi:phage baseplate assembly protein W